MAPVARARPAARDPRTREPTLPVGDVDWNEAARVLARVGLELPTEAQWEYAARAGTTTPWWTGPDRGSLSGAELFAPKPLSPVGRLRPNAFGLHDVAGNVAEWCRDRFARYEFPRAPGIGRAARRSTRPERPRLARRLAPLACGRSPLRADAAGDSPNMRRPDLGIRPARQLDR